MGKVSNSHALSLQSVILCSQRREIIRAAKYCRHDLVTTFVMYMESLSEIGNSLNNYVEKELIFDKFCGHLEFPSDDSDSDSDFVCDSDLESLFHHVHHHVEEEEEEPKRTYHYILEVEDDESDTLDGNVGKTGRAQSTRTCTSTPKTANQRDSKKGPQIHMSHEDFGNQEHVQKMETLGTPVYFSSQGMETLGNPMYFSHYNNMFVHYAAEAFAMGVPTNHGQVSQNQGTEEIKTNTSTVIPPPPPPQDPTWDFLFPFNMNPGHGVSYEYDLQDEKEIRKREGIPDLEDDVSIESEESFHSTTGVFYQKEIEDKRRHGSGNDGTSNATNSNAKKGAFSINGNQAMVRIKTNEKKKCDLGPKAKVQDIKSPKAKPTAKVQDIKSPKAKVQDTESSETCRMSLKEALVDLCNQFKCVVDSGKEFSSVIEVCKPPHHSVCTKLRVFASCVLGLMIPSAKRCLYPSYMSYQPASRARCLSKADMKSNQDHVTSCDLLSTFDKLHVWENKLYTEVKGEQKLGILYDKQYKRLKEMDARGSGPDEIDEAHASFKLLHSQIDVAVSSIRAKSREIHELRDKKLFPELNKLIEGLSRLWRAMNTCHQKQFKAIENAKGHVHILDYGGKKKSSIKATMRLEKVVLNWGECFRNFINTQKKLVKHLQNWHLRFILQEFEEHKKGTSSLLPNDDAEAPPIFIICKNWYDAINKISETGVFKAINTFASSLHKLYKILKEEEAEKAKVKKLLKNYQRELQSYCDENGVDTKNYASFITMKSSEIFKELFPVDEIPKLTGENLAISRTWLVEQKKKHRQVSMRANDVASNCFHEGLTPIFDSLQSFCLENLKVYEQLSVSSSGSGTNE